MIGPGFGPRGSASETIAWAVRADRRPVLFTDEHRSPVDPESVVPALVTLLAGTHRGTFHLGGPERLSRHDLGLRVARVLGLPPDRIDAARQADHPLPAPRPADVSLDSGRAIRELGYRPRPVDEAIGDGRPGPDVPCP
jgi:dTDP-4-dehydrorhamnose reductase